MTDMTRTSRIAGAAYLGIILLGLSAELAIRGPMIDWTDEAATAAAIAADPGRIGLSVVADLGMIALDLLVGLLLFRLLRPYGAGLAAAALGLRLIQAAIIAINLPALLAARAAAMDGSEVLPHLMRHAAGYDLGLIFFGVGTVLTAILLYRAAAPRLLVAGLGLTGLVYLAGSLTRFFAPEINAAMQPAYLIPMLAETGFALWLLLRGVRGGAVARA